MRTLFLRLLVTAIVAVATAELAGCTSRAEAADGARQVKLLNCSYDATRELYKDLNAAFAAHYEAETHTVVSIRQSHGGSSSQARSVIEGLDADVVTLASFRDVDVIRKRGLIAPGWLDRLPAHSLPYTSTIVFVVRKGNPKRIADWSDLVKPDVGVIVPNPKTSGNGYLAFFSAWGSVVLRGGSDSDALDYVTRLYGHVPVLESGARGAAATFVQRKIGDVQLAWESEAFLELREAHGELGIVYPPISIRAEPHVAVVDGNVDVKGTRRVAEAYLSYMYGQQAQEIIARHHYRPMSPAVLERHAADFPALRLFSIGDIAKDFDDAYTRFIGEGGVFDSIYKPHK